MAVDAGAVGERVGRTGRRGRGHGQGGRRSEAPADGDLGVHGDGQAVVAGTAIATRAARWVASAGRSAPSPVP